MTFDLFGIDFYLSARLFGFWFLSFKGDNLHRSLISIYYSDRELLVDLFWFRILTHWI